ncbi:FMN-binding negative transcriptional regulator [Thioalkalivibrio denitrificans]|nr:FMN-binding negative transcriptional regulator [Thioalkalivibrio denitrificans]
MRFDESRLEVMHALIRAYPLATVVTHSLEGLNANHLPLYLSQATSSYGVLRGHIARANPLALEVVDGIETLAIFRGPDSYITPSWYATKKETGKVVPTWNYAVVHAYGVLRAVDDASWLRRQLDDLTEHNESSFPEPWAVSDAPPDYIERIMAAIVGVEMVITKLLGKWKVSQNQSTRNQIGVIAGLKDTGLPESEVMASMVEARTKNPSQ